MYIAIVSWTKDNKLAKVKEFDLEAEANEHVTKFGGFVVADPEGSHSHWVIDPVAKTVIFDEVTFNADQALRAWVSLREERDIKLAATDWRGNSDVTMGTAWTTYRKKLRDFPATLDNTTVQDDITWPTEPS